MDVGRVTVGKVELEYELRGRPGDRPLVLVNGLGRPHVGWDPRFVDQFVDAGFRVLCADNRDSGRSTHVDDAPPLDWEAALRGDRSAVAYSLDDMAADTAGLIAELDLGPVHLVGASMGGMICQMVAADHPERARSLCSIMSTTGARDVGRPTPEAQAVLMRRPPGDRDGFIEHEMANHEVIGSTAAYADDDWSRSVFARIYDYGVYPPGTGRQLLAVTVRGDRTDALRRVRVPTLVVHGDADTLIDVSGGRATAEAIDGAELMVVEGLGHELPPKSWPVIVPAVVSNARRADAEAVAR